MNTAYPRRVPSIFATSLVLFFVGIVFFAALLNRANDLAVLSIFVLGLAGALRLWTQFSSVKLKSIAILDKYKLFTGDELSLKIRVENKKLLPVGLVLACTDNNLLNSFSYDTIMLKTEESLLWYQKADFNWKLTAEKRGVYKIGPIKISSGDLFGFFIQDNNISDILLVVVYPKLIPLISFSFPKREFFGIPGGKNPVHDPAYFLGTADYHYSRPARFIHWKASARHFRLQEKIFDSTQQEKVLLILDVEQFVKAATEIAFERILEVIASIAVQLAGKGCAAGFVTNCVMEEGASGVVPVSGNMISPTLETLARVKMETAEALIDIILRAVPVSIGTTCVYFAFKEDPAVYTVIECFKRRKTPVIFYSFEHALELRREKIDINASCFYKEADIDTRITNIKYPNYLQ